MFQFNEYKTTLETVQLVCREWRATAKMPQSWAVFDYHDSTTRLFFALLGRIPFVQEQVLPRVSVIKVDSKMEDAKLIKVKDLQQLREMRHYVHDNIAHTIRENTRLRELHLHGPHGDSDNDAFNVQPMAKQVTRLVVSFDDHSPGNILFPDWTEISQLRDLRLSFLFLDVDGIGAGNNTIHFLDGDEIGTANITDKGSIVKLSKVERNENYERPWIPPVGLTRLDLMNVRLNNSGRIDLTNAISSLQRLSLQYDFERCDAQMPEITCPERLRALTHLRYEHGFGTTRDDLPTNLLSLLWAVAAPIEQIVGDADRTPWNAAIKRGDTNPSTLRVLHIDGDLRADRCRTVNTQAGRIGYTKVPRLSGLTEIVYLSAAERPRYTRDGFCMTPRVDACLLKNFLGLQLIRVHLRLVSANSAKNTSRAEYNTAFATLVSGAPSLRELLVLLTNNQSPEEFGVRPCTTSHLKRKLPTDTSIQFSGDMLVAVSNGRDIFSDPLKTKSIYAYLGDFFGSSDCHPLTISVILCQSSTASTTYLDTLPMAATMLWQQAATVVVYNTSLVILLRRGVAMGIVCSAQKAAVTETRIRLAELAKHSFLPRPPAPPVFD